jgi:hypothetical protein
MRLFSFTAARTAQTCITLRALTVFWAGVWHVCLYNNTPVTHPVRKNLRLGRD